MNDDYDIEKTLKRYRSDPGPHVKQSVLQRFRAGAAVRPAAVFWKRPVPLYVVAAQIILAVALAFFAGQWTAGIDRELNAPGEAATLENATSPRELEWQAARNDLL